MIIDSGLAAGPRTCGDRRWPAALLRRARFRRMTGRAPREQRPADRARTGVAPAGAVSECAGIVHPSPGEGGARCAVPRAIGSRRARRAGLAGRCRGLLGCERRAVVGGLTRAAASPAKARDGATRPGTPAGGRVPWADAIALLCLSASLPVRRQVCPAAPRARRRLPRRSAPSTPWLRASLRRTRQVRRRGSWRTESPPPRTGNSGT